ncbi:TPA: hypothetical protein N0F65_001276, partial [Lagenidium giganteum]
RERLEGWIVQQIENADLAKETVIQLPTHVTAAASSQQSLQPRGTLRRPFTSPIPFSSAGSGVGREEKAASPRHPRRPKFLNRSRCVSAENKTPTHIPAKDDDEDSVTRQWNMRFSHGQRQFIESTGVDRSKVLRDFAWEGALNDEDDDGTSTVLSPFSLWGLPREQILEYIRQTVLPSSWATIHLILTELRSDPAMWAQFEHCFIPAFSDNFLQQKIRQYKARQRQPVPLTPRRSVTRKKKHDERCERVKRQRELLMRREEERLDAKLAIYRRRVQGKFGDARGSGQNDGVLLAQSLALRRTKTWLVVVISFSIAVKWRQAMHRMKHLLLAERMQTKAACTIQRIYRRWKWQHASKHTIVVYTWLRKCLWKLLLRLRIRRKIKHANLLRRFMLDHLTESRETRNFNRMMVRWRSNVIHSQRLGMNFVQCTHARMYALSLWFDTLDHERQRQERQLHERANVTDEKEAEWNAMIHNRKLTRGASPAKKDDSDAGATKYMIDQMDERLTSMQQLMTPIELQRLHHKSYHIVRIPKAIKHKLLQEFLRAGRQEYIHALSRYHEQVLCATYSREVKLDDARAIVQNAATWDALLSTGQIGPARVQPPVFKLYSGERMRRQMEELVFRGVQLTLESDVEQRVLVERQKTRRTSVDHTHARGSRHDSTQVVLASAAAVATAAMLSSGMTPPTAAPAPLPHGGGLANMVRKSNRRLTFVLPQQHQASQ